MSFPTPDDPVEIIRIELETVELYHDDRGLLGEVNEFEFNSFRIGIMNRWYANGIEGITPYYYTLKGDSERFYFDWRGQPSDWCGFNMYESQLTALTDWMF
jgi:hypothetical protein